MAIRRLKPTSPGTRHRSNEDRSDLQKTAPEKSLLAPRVSTGGRNSDGRITTRHKGGGHKKRLRIIDFKRDKDNIDGLIKSIEYDPNRNARIALVCYKDGEKRYIIASDGLKKGDTVLNGQSADIKLGNALKLKFIPVGTVVHNVELRPGKGAQVARSAGVFAQLLSKEGKYCHVRLPSGEIRLVNAECVATIGQVGNTEASNISLGKAGRSRLKGIRPTVRGVAMNPVDHPHGGGEGRTSGGRHPTTPWGKPTKGYKTRKKNKQSSKYIVSRGR